MTGPGTQAQATANSVTEQLKVFATCAGRYSALMEHQWLTYDPASDQSELIRADFVDLIDALVPVARSAGLPKAQPLGWRISAKASLQVLLQRATFGKGREAEMARTQAGRKLAACRTMLLS